MKYLIYLALFAIAFGNLSSLEPELYNPEGVTFTDPYSGSKFLEFNNEIYLVGTDEQFGSQVWKFDGTIVGIERVIDLPENSDPAIIDIVNDKLIFATSAQNGERINFWSIDSKDNLSMLLTDFEFPHKRTRQITYSHFGQRFINNDKMYLNVLTRDLNTDSIISSELIVTDGLKENTRKYSFSESNNNVMMFYNVNNKVLTFDYGSSGEKLSLSVLNEDNSFQEIGSYEGNYSILYPRINLDQLDRFCFKITKENSSCDELYISDGTKSGTIQIIEIKDSLEIKNNVYNNFNRAKIIIARNKKVKQIGKLVLILTDGSIEKTFNLSDEIIKDSIEKITLIDEINGKFIFSTYSNEGYNIWATDGTENGTINVLSKDSTYSSKSFVMKSIINNNLYFLINNENDDYILVETDGTLENTSEKLNLTGKMGDSIFGLWLFDNTYKNNIVIVNNGKDIYFYNPLDDSLELKQIFSYFDAYTPILYDNTFYLKKGRLYFFNEYRNLFEEIKPNDVIAGFTIREKLLYKNYFYFFADYYGNNEFKLYRIDNTFQTVSNIETQPTDELNFYPNPTGDFLNISVDEPTSVSIIDLTGKVVMSIESYSGGGINTSQLSTGVYSIILDENTYGGKFVKE